MQLIFGDPYYDTDGYEENPTRYLTELEVKLKEFDENVILKESDIGHGADYPTVTAILDIINIMKEHPFISTADVLFFNGERINKNIDGWLGILKKINLLIEKIKPYRIDEHAALVVALNKIIIEKHGEDLSELSAELKIIDFGNNEEINEGFEKRPEALYLITIKAQERIYIVGIKSNGKIEFTHDYETEWFNFDK